MQCVKAQDAAKTDIKADMVASGDPAQMEEWLKEVRERRHWQLDADAQSDGIRFARLSADASIPYREIGGLIYSGQARRLSITFQLEPPICEAEEN